MKHFDTSNSGIVCFVSESQSKNFHEERNLDVCFPERKEKEKNSGLKY